MQLQRQKVNFLKIFVLRFFVSNLYVRSFTKEFMKDIVDMRERKVASNIRKIREYRNYTQEYLAARLNISQNAYSKIELGYTKITVERLFQIADVLEYDVIDLLSIKPEIIHSSRAV